ncbi:MAG: N-acetylmuramoyl-L-alanine amidase [Amphritea sp.]|nr:N-acetylmuramoyl-L-alanine amidase [Amphritea sp.]
MAIRYVVAHCSDTPNDRDVSAADIHRWHGDPKPRGNGWAGIGYHYVIRRDGTVEHGRPHYWPGSHVRGKNSVSIGICLIGRDGFTDEQMAALGKLVDELLIEFPGAEVVGHRDLDSKKTCPNFDVKRWYRERL